MTTFSRSLGVAGGLVTRRLDRLSDRSYALVTGLPAIVIIVGVLLPPIIAVTAMSLFRIELVKDTNTPFVGLNNYARIARDADFLASVPRTVLLGAATTLLAVPVALFTALVLDRVKRGGAILGVVVLLPWAIAPVVTGQFWGFIFNSHFGILTGIATGLGLVDGPVRWLEEPTTAMAIAAMASAWRTVPLLALILLAALKSMPPSLERAARMDGAGTWQVFRHVTLPSIRNSLLVAAILSVILSLSLFDILFTLTGGGPGRETTVMPYYVYLRAFQNLSLGYSASLAIVLLLTVVGCSLLLARVTRPSRPQVVVEVEVEALPAHARGIGTRLGSGAAVAALPPLVPRHPRWQVPHLLTRAAFQVTLALLVGWMVLPLLWIVLASLQTESAITVAPPALDLVPTFEWYARLLVHPRWLGSLAVSTAVALGTMAITIVLGGIAAYPLARYDVPGKGAILAAIAFTQMVPGVVLAIPILLMFGWFRLRDTVPGLILIDAAFLLPLAIWLLRNYIIEVPRSIESAARIDGCSRLGTLFRVVLPAAAPGIAAVAILVLIATWNEFLFAVVLGDREAVTVTRRITDLQSLSPVYGVIYAERAAAGILAVLPPMVLVLLFHRRIVRGITTGFVKG